MGITIGSKSSYDRTERVVERIVYKDAPRDNVKLPNPDPARYVVINHVQIGTTLIVKIKYIDCVNYEGVKILLYKNTELSNLLKQKMIDPHFSENKKYLSPFARFEPTYNGWNAAVKLAKLLTN